MTTTLDVLVIGDRSSDAAEAALSNHGHRVHRCHEPEGHSFPCAGLVDPSACPLHSGIDVALVVRRGVHPWPLPEEDGVRCALRAGIPLVEDGVDALDPYEAWLTARVGTDGDVVVACVEAAGRRDDALRNLVRDRIGPLTGALQVHPGDVDVVIERDDRRLRVDLTVPAAIDRRLQQAFAVRTLDAVRASGGSYDQVNVDVRGIAP
jgi:hypothetical protein